MNGQKRNHKINQLMHNDNSNCYDIEKESNDSFFFVTDNGVRYVAEFTNNNMGMDFNESKILEFSFYHSDKSTNHDKKVSSTIAIILKPYLNDSLNIVYYICDQTDGKHHARRRLFLRWYRDLSTLELVLYETKVTDNNEIEYYIFVIANKLNPSYDKLIPKIESLTEEFNSVKRQE